MDQTLRPYKRAVQGHSIWHTVHAVQSREMESRVVCRRAGLGGGQQKGQDARQ